MTVPWKRNLQMQNHRFKSDPFLCSTRKLNTIEIKDKILLPNVVNMNEKKIKEAIVECNVSVQIKTSKINTKWIN